MIFVDTGAWFAALVPDDANHSVAAEFLRSNDESLVITDYILDELPTLLKARGHLARAEVVENEFARSEAGHPTR